jgi:hypothetical protein
MTFFHPLVRSSPMCVARLRTLEGAKLWEGDPTMMFMSNYLLSLDK